MLQADAAKATTLAPSYVKGWARLARAQLEMFLVEGTAANRAPSDTIADCPPHPHTHTKHTHTKHTHTHKAQSTKHTPLHQPRLSLCPAALSNLPSSSPPTGAFAISAGLWRRCISVLPSKNNASALTLRGKGGDRGWACAGPGGQITAETVGRVGRPHHPVVGGYIIIRVPPVRRVM